MPDLDTEVLIVGAGPVGATLAGLLGNRGIDCVVIDSRETAGDIDTVDPRALALTQASRRILESFGLWSKLPEERVGRFRRMQVWDENGKGGISFDCQDLGRDTLGHIVEQSVLEHTLNKVLEYVPSITILRGASLGSLVWHEHFVEVNMDNGKTLNAGLVVAADGVNSLSRQLAGIGFVEDDYEQQALACVVRTERHHEEVARQRFLSDGPLAFLPMANPHQCGIVWSTTPARAQGLLTMDPDEFHAALGAAFENRLGAVTGSESRATFPLKRAYAETYCRERFTLVGDAAHSIHPLAGQGANLGLLDVACLAEVLTEARARKRDIGGKNTLRKYERWRKGDNHLMMRVMDGFKYLFEKQDEPLPVLRNAGMDLMNSMSPLKRFIMRRAMGLEGDLPGIARV